MEWILTELIGSAIQSSDWLVDKILESLVPMAFYAEKFMIGATVINFSEIYIVMFSFGIALIVLRFLKKGFDTYVGWNDGDADADALGLFVNFIRAIVVATCFPVLYNWLVNATEDIIDKVLNVSNMLVSLTSPTEFIWRVASSAGLGMVLFSLILIIMYIILYFQFIMRGIEMLVMRIGMPIVCVGLIDNDKGIFQPYMKKFFLNSATVLVQVVLVKMSLLVLVLSNNMIYAVAIAMVATKTPRFLQEFMLVHSGGGSIINTVYHTSRLVQMAKSAVRKGS